MVNNVFHATCSKNIPRERDCTFGFDHIFPFCLGTLHFLRCVLLSRMKTEAGIGLVAFHISDNVFVSYSTNKDLCAVQHFDTHCIKNRSVSNFIVL